MYVYVCVCVCEILIPVVYLTLLAWGHIVVEWGGPGHLIVLGQPTSTHTNTHTHTHTNIRKVEDLGNILPPVNVLQ